MKGLLFAFFTIFILSGLGAQEYRITKGGVTNSLAIPGAPGETYALYIPRDYSPEMNWPVIFTFDPQGRGAKSASLFRLAAENQQYIIAASNFNLQNRPVDSIVRKAAAMMDNVLRSFPVDPLLVYTAGMEEGAQVASALPLIYKKMAGVMAIGNSFVNANYLDKENPYMFIGIAGKKDYMVYEMEDYLRFYDDLDFPTDVYYFDGKQNEWPSAQVISNAVTGFTLEAIRKGKRPDDPEFIKKLFEDELAFSESLRRTRQYHAAFEKLDRMKVKYEDYGFEEVIEEKKKEIKRIKNYRSQKNKFRQAVAFEKEQQREYEYLLKTDIMTANFQNIGWWAYQIDELNKLKDKDEVAQSNMAHRLLGYLDFVSKREFDEIMRSQANIDIKIFISVLRTAINKEDPEAYFKIISLAALDGDEETALLYLEDLLKTGYNDLESLYNIEGALDLQFNPEYNAIIKRYLGESKFFNE
ncbi:hypothetical protein [Christiangramia sabulilitoris]|uniref:Alpha/beta hydrolase n=1 Tax=Christiangramia sabulilitoris TaxID=2583991 RepID=A0A550HZ20_9FLAO|nr:hypothetical protein [Christiangramia sabulilitoris]TRO63981.1 hypothetical protein FGM01_10755 [Christiangramia sabulilitoris]